MVSYEVPKPPQGFFSRMKDSVRLAAAFVKGDRDTISDITSQTVFSPLQPIRSATPQIVGRTWDYAPGQNVQYLPRGYGSGRIPFMTLRQFSRSCEVLRLGIETVKDQIGAYGWQIVPKEDAKVTPEDQRIKDVSAFLRKPDKVNNFDQWMRTIVEEFLVTDAVSVYRRKDRIGRPYAFEIIDGATIKPLIDADGMRPLPPDPAFQQIIKGAPRAMYDSTELLYMPRNVLAYDPSYGLSIVEQIIVTAQTAIERAKYQLAYFTEGSMPDSYAALPENMTPDQIREFEDRFNNMMKGNAAGRREVPFFPAGTEISSLKQPPLKDDFDEWIARIIAYALGLSPTWAIKQMNRSTSETDQKREEEQGQSPKLQYLANVMNELLADFGEDFIADFEFKWRDNNEIDADKQSQIEDRNVRNATSTINEIRRARGQDPIEGGDMPMVLTASGYVPLDSYERNQVVQRETMEAQAKSKAESEKKDVDENNRPEDKTEKNTQIGFTKEAGQDAEVPFPENSIQRIVTAYSATVESILNECLNEVKPQIEESLEDVEEIDQTLSEKQKELVSLDIANIIVMGLSLTSLLRFARETVSFTEEASLIGVSFGLKQIETQKEKAEEVHPMWTGYKAKFETDKIVDVVNERAVFFARDRAAEMVGMRRLKDGTLIENPNAKKRIDVTTRKELRDAIADGLRDNIGSQKIIENIIKNKAFDKKRAKIIAGHEIRLANSMASLESYLAAQKLGINIKKSWINAEGPCPICSANAAQGPIDLKNKFQSGELTPPAHVNCRCSLVPIIT